MTENDVRLIAAEVMRESPEYELVHRWVKRRERWAKRRHWFVKGFWAALGAGIAAGLLSLLGS